MLTASRDDPEILADPAAKDAAGTAEGSVAAPDPSGRNFFRRNVFRRSASRREVPRADDFPAKDPQEDDSRADDSRADDSRADGPRREISPEGHSREHGEGGLTDLKDAPSAPAPENPSKEGEKTVCEGEKTVCEDETGGEDEKKRLGEEIAALEGTLASLREETRRREEEKELFSLFPALEEGFDRASLPEEVDSLMKEGLPLTAAYALFFCRKEREMRLAEGEREKNRLRSAGALGAPGQGGSAAPGGGNFTLSEIAAMSRREVRHYYREIMQSLEDGA